MKVWLTGARGMLGSALRERLESERIAHVATDAELDIADRDAVITFARRERPDLVVNAAAYTRVDDAEHELQAAHRANALGPASLARAAVEVEARILHFSTDYVFDGTAAAPYGEDASTRPLGVYARTKLDGERFVLSQAAERACIVRTSWLFGPGGKNFVTTMLSAMEMREELRVVDDQRGRPSYTRDLVEAALALCGVGTRALTAPVTGLIHYANAGETTWHGFASEIRQQALARGSKIRTERILPITTGELARPAPRPAYSVLSTARVESLGVSPRPWQAALSDYLDEISRSALG